MKHSVYTSTLENYTQPLQPTPYLQCGHQIFYNWYLELPPILQFLLLEVILKEKPFTKGSFEWLVKDSTNYHCPKILEVSWGIGKLQWWLVVVRVANAMALPCERWREWPWSNWWWKRVRWSIVNLRDSGDGGDGGAGDNGCIKFQNGPRCET